MIEAALELRLVLPYSHLPGGAHLSKAHVSCGSCVIEFRRAFARTRRATVLREFVALFLLVLAVAVNVAACGELAVHDADVDAAELAEVRESFLEEIR